MKGSVDGTDGGSDPNVDPSVLEGPMTFNSKKGRYEFVFSTQVDLDGRRVIVSSDKGSAYNGSIE